MKYNKLILFIFLFLLSAGSVQASQNALLDKLNGIWIGDEITVAFDIEKNLLTSISGKKYYEFPLIIKNKIANVLLFEGRLGRKYSVRYLTPELISFSFDSSDLPPFILNRWYDDVSLLNKIQGTWYNDRSTVIYDFNINQKTYITGSDIVKSVIKNVETKYNVLIYENEDGIKYAVHYIKPETITLFGNYTGKYEIFRRWHENQ